MKRLLTAALFVLALALALALGPAGLQAQPENYPDDFDEGGAAPITGSIGIGAGYAPEFVGSNKSRVKMLPVVFLNYGPVFLNMEKGLGVRFDLLDGRLEISPAVNYRFQRREGDSALLAGMGNVHDVITLGGTLAYRFDDFVLAVKSFQGMNQSKGFTMDLKASYLNRSHTSFNYGLSVSTSLADKRYNQTYFGVTGAQSLASGYRTFNAPAGFNDVGLKGTFDYFLSPQLSVDVFAGYTYLLGVAGDSPLVEKGSENQFSTGLVLLYHFGN
jgi:outer membrane scaffolding protein for murein synthesis (MipA/OmpV family)